MREEILVSIGILLIIVISASILSPNVFYTRSIVVVAIGDNKIDDARMGFQKISIKDGLFEIVAPGELRLSIEAQSRALNETAFSIIKNGIGPGITATPIKFPNRNETWNLRISLRKKDLTLLDQKCYGIEFIKGNETSLEVGQKENDC